MAEAPRRFALVPSAGTSTRFGGEHPKQYAPVGGIPMLVRTLEALLRWGELDAIFVVLAHDDAHYTRVALHPERVVALRCGGATRLESVANGLDAMQARVRANDWVLVHDAARPCIGADALSRLVSEVGDDAVGGLLAMPIADTLKRAGADDSRVHCTEDRHGLWCAQTPQMFRYALLREAIGRARGAAMTDDAQAVEALGMRPRLVRGSASNLKITYPDDLALAEAVIALRERAP
ncbi:MAG: 2-C-methyl-D-erythritol 4-phosphate cytidylyltransferase [Betaproteobacteria bacterium]